MKKVKYILPAVILAAATLFSACTVREATEIKTVLQSTSEDRTPETAAAYTTELTSQSTAPEGWSALEVPTEPVETEPPMAAVSVFRSTGSEMDNVSLEIHGDRAVVMIPLTVPKYEMQNISVGFTASDGTAVEPRIMDLTVENYVDIPDGKGGSVTYTVTGERESFGLSVLEITTDSGAAVSSKTEYAHGTLTVDGTEYPMNIKGRGNASWRMFPKKAYRIKLDDGASLLGLPQNRDWVLTSNYPDKTLIRNAVAHTVAASLSGIKYTATHIPVNLYINGEYKGVYTFGDKIEEGNGRLDLGEPQYGADGGAADVGFLLEIGWDFDGENVYNKDYFDAKEVVRIYVKEPDVPYANTTEFTYLKNYVLQMENAILTDKGWENYIDVDSWVDWFIVNELTFNMESSFYRSCYLWRPVGGKMNLGPVWDFDMAFGNHHGDIPGYNGWCTTESKYQYISTNWMNYLMTYPAFTDRVVERWNEVKGDLLDTALGAVDTYSAMLDGSEQANFEVWNIMTSSVGASSVNGKVYDTYGKQVQYLRDFINNRWQYMDTRLNSAEYSPESGE